MGFIAAVTYFLLYFYLYRDRDYFYPQRYLTNMLVVLVVSSLVGLLGACLTTNRHLYYKKP